MNKIFTRFLLSYILILLIPILCVGFFGYWWVGTIISDQIEESYNSVIKELSSSIDEQLKELSILTIQLSSTPWVKKVMYMQNSDFDYKRMDVLELKDSILALKGYDIVNNFFDNVILYFPRQKIAISSSGENDAEVFFNDVFKLSGYNYTDWDKMLNFYGSSRIMALTDLEHNGQHENVLTYIQPIPSKDQKGHAYFIAFIKENEIISRLERFRISSDSSIYIMDKEGIPVIEVNGNQSFPAMVRKLDLYDNSDARSVIENNGKRYFIFHKQSTVNKWMYVASIPYDVVMEKVSYIKNVTIIVVVALFIIGMLIAYSLASNNYDPILSLVNTMKMRFSVKDISSSNDYDYLQKSINMLLVEDDLLKRQAEQQKPFIRNASFLELLNGNIIKVRPYLEFLESVDVKLKYPLFITSMYVLNSVRGINSELQKTAIELSESYEGCAYFVEISGNKKAVIINISDKIKLKELVSELKLLVENSLGIECLVGVGGVKNSISDLKVSYDEAEQAVNYKLADKGNDIIFYTQVKESNSYYFFPTEKEVEILSALRRGNYEDTREVIKDILAINKNRGLSLENGRSMFYSMIDTAGKALNTAEDIDFDNLDGMATLEEIEDYLLTLCKRICDFINDNKTLHNVYLKSNILRYIDENYNNQSLSLESIAEFTNKSVPYMSKVFKEQLGMNFLDYLNRKRISKAKELLDGQLTVTQIATFVGYNSDVTFRRVFKKYEGITPGEYIMTNQQMKEYKKQNENILYGVNTYEK